MSARTVTVRVRGGHGMSFKRALEQFQRRVLNEQIEKDIQKNRIYVKPNIKRRLNKKNTKYFLARKQVVGEYMDMVKKGHVVRVPDSKF